MATDLKESQKMVDEDVLARAFVFCLIFHFGWCGRMLPAFGTNNTRTNYNE
jgi:hypothetical protein